MKKYRIIAASVPGFIEIDARDEHDAMLKASAAGLSVRSIIVADTKPRTEKLLEKLISYVVELKRGLTYEENRTFWKDHIGMTEDEMKKYEVEE